jgi:D-alanine-D-alanine ligase
MMASRRGSSFAAVSQDLPMNITILTYLEKEDAKEHDIVVDQVAKALEEQKHKVSILGVHGDAKKLIAGLERRKPQLVFNLLEMFGKNLRSDVAVAGLLDLLEIQYTGGGPGELYLRQDKALAKRALAYEKLLYPDFAVFSTNADMETGGNLRMPLFVKPLRSDASIGIDSKALVRDATALMKQVIMIHDKHKDAAIAEEYIEGRELYVGVLGNRDPLAFPPIEIDFSGLPEGAPKVMDTRAKWVKSSKEYKGTKSVLAQLPDDLNARVQKVAVDAYRALRVKDYGRVDLRVADTGDIYVIEINANCYLEEGSEFAVAAKAAGIEYNALINKIVDLAVERYQFGN